jgi:hypothetical protein
LKSPNCKKKKNLCKKLKKKSLQKKKN